MLFVGIPFFNSLFAVGRVLTLLLRPLPCLLPCSYSWQYIPGTGIPGVPRNVAVNAASASDAKSAANDGGFSLPVTISWDAPTENGGSDITKYEVTIKSTNPTRSQTFTLSTDDGSTSSLTTYIPEGITYGFHVSAANIHGTSANSQPAVNYRATDSGEPCSSVDCSGHGTCSISGSSVGCVCLPFYSTSGSIPGTYCDKVQKFNVRHEGVTVGLFLNTLSNYDWERCFKSADDNGGNSNEDDVLPCTASGDMGSVGVQVRSDPEQCSQIYDLTTDGLSFDFRATVTGNSCEERNKETPVALAETLTTWNAEMRGMAKEGINRACMEKLATSECDGDYLKVIMTIVDEGTAHDHISLMLANPSSRVEFEQRLGNEIHLLLNNVRAQQVYVDKIDFGVLVNGERKGGATLYGKGEKDLAVVQWRIRPGDNGTDMTKMKASIDALKSTQKLANTRWLKAVDTSTLTSEIVKLGEVECLEDDYLCIVTHLAPWQIALIVVGVLVVLVGLFCLFRKCCGGGSGGDSSPYGKSGDGFGRGSRGGTSSFRGGSGLGGSRRGSGSSHSRLHDEDDDEVDLLTGGSSSRGVDIEMRGGIRRNKGENAFGL